MNYSLSFFANGDPSKFWGDLSADTAKAAADRARAAGCTPNWIHGGTVWGCCTQYTGPSVGEVLANLKRHDAVAK
jgi:hypothetical protein